MRRSDSSSKSNRLDLKLRQVDEKLLAKVHISRSYLDKTSRLKESLPTLPKGYLAARPSLNTRTRSWLLYLTHTWLRCLLHSSHTTLQEYP
jgi:hypothetical protein